MADPDTVRRNQEARRGLRYPAQFDGSFVVDRRAIRITIADISCVGACVTGDDLPERGVEGILRLAGLEVVATVVWSKGTSCGLNFHRTIEPLAVVRRNMVVPGGNSRVSPSAMRA